MSDHLRSAPRRGTAIGAVTLGLGMLTTAGAAADDPSATEAIVIDVGTGFAPEVTVHMFDAVIVPGDTIERTFRVRNDGPTDATMTVDLVDVTHVGELDAFFDDLTMNGTPVAQLVGVDTRLQESEIALGEIVDVPLELHFPAEATSGNRAEVGERGASFRVRVTMTGDTPGPGPTEPPGGTATPTPGRPGSAVPAGGTTSVGLPVDGARAAGPVAMPRTGPDVRTTLLLAVALVGGGLAARAARRRFGSGGTGESS